MWHFFFFPLLFSISEVILKIVFISFFQRMQRTPDNEARAPELNPQDVAQLVFFCVDQSGSMSSKFDKGSLNILEACIEFIESFTNRADRCNVPSLYALNTFGMDAYHKLDFTSNTKDLESALSSIRLGGATAMFKAILEATNKIIAENGKYPSAIKRIIVLTDGGDNVCTPEIKQLLHLVIQNHIIVDAIIVSDYIEWRLVSFAKMTGGISVVVPTLEKGLSLFENEAFYNPAIRAFPPANFDPENLNNKEQPLNSEITTINQKAFQTALGPKAAIKQYEKTSEDSSSIKEILKQIRIIANSSDPSIRIVVNESNINQWKAYIKPSVESKYGSKWWELSISFPETYPNTAPNFRFITVPFHPNINEHGLICMKLLNEDYKPEIDIINLIRAIQNLLVCPDYESPVDITRAVLFSQYVKKQHIEKCTNQEHSNDELKAIDDKINTIYSNKIQPLITHSVEQNYLDDNLLTLPQQYKDALENENNISIE